MFCCSGFIFMCLRQIISRFFMNLSQPLVVFIINSSYYFKYLVWIDKMDVVTSKKNLYISIEYSDIITADRCDKFIFNFDIICCDDIHFTQMICCVRLMTMFPFNIFNLLKFFLRTFCSTIVCTWSETRETMCCCLYDWII